MALDLEAAAEAPYRSRHAEDRNNERTDPARDSRQDSDSLKSPSQARGYDRSSESTPRPTYSRSPVHSSSPRYKQTTSRSDDWRPRDREDDGRLSRYDLDNRSERTDRSSRHDRGDRRDDIRDRSRRDGGRDRHRRDDCDRDRDRSYARRDRERHDDRHRSSYRSRSPARSSYRDRPPRRARTPSPPSDSEERDSRTIFVQQLAARLRTKELIAFFEKAGPVRDAQIVKDRVSGRSKGVGYVEFVSADTVPAALTLTGQKLLGLPIIAQLTEAEKNRQAREEALKQGKAPGRPAGKAFLRLYVGNIHFSIGEDDLQAIFESFGELEFVTLTKDAETGRSRGYGFVQFKDAAHAKEALEKMNGFELAGRSIRVGLGNDQVAIEGVTHPKAEPDIKPAATAQQAVAGEGQDRAEADAAPTADADLGEVHISRAELMRKLARDDSTPVRPVIPIERPPVCVMLRNMFDPAEETEHNWQQELRDDVVAECNEKYGKVVHCHLDDRSLGEIFVKFADTQGAQKAIAGLQGRSFGGRTIGAAPLPETIYNQKFGL